METCAYTVLSAPPDTIAYVLALGAIIGAATYAMCDIIVRRLP